MNPNSEIKHRDYIAGETLLLDKPLNWTSFDVVNKIRYALKRKLGVRKIKVGHAGTLDPLATGLLIICTGKATKQINQLQGLTKTYTGTITLGSTTPSYDLESEPENFKDFSQITSEEIETCAKSFLGHQAQMPPIFSAKKVDGQVAYLVARKGGEINLKPNTIEILAFNISAVDLPKVHFEVKATKGTYIRSLAHDFGQRLGCGGHLSALRRTEVGNFNLEKAYSMDQIIEAIDD